MSLPREIRDPIYEGVICSQGAAQLIHPSLRDCKTDEDEIRFPEDVAPRYPQGDKNTNLDTSVDSDYDDDEDEGSFRESGDELDELGDEQGWTDEDDGTSDSDGSEEEDLEDHYHENPTGRAVSSGKNLDVKTAIHDLSCDSGAYTTARSADTLLDDFLDGMDSDEDVDDDVSDEGDMEDSLFRKPRPRHPRSRYKLETLEPLDLALLRVSREVYDEVLPIFYGSIAFLVDTDPLSVVRVFKALPNRARESITTLAISSEAMMTDDRYARAAWSHGEIPIYDGPPKMVTPFGTFLATALPSLSKVYLYAPYGGVEDWYPSLAPVEMQMLLAHGCIKTLCFVFSGEEVAEDLSNGLSSQRCFDRWMGQMHTTDFARHKFELSNPEPDDDSMLGSWLKRGDEYVKAYVPPFSWRWGDRNISMGSDGNVQAVVELYLGNALADS